MAWVDYEKAYDSVPHCWLLQGLQPSLVQVPVACDGGLEDIYVISHGKGTDEDHAGQIFQGDSVSPLGSQSSDYGV